MTDDKQTDKSVPNEPAAIVPSQVVSVQPVLPAESGLEMQSLIMKGLQAKFQSGDLSVIDTIVAIESDRIKFDQSLRQQELDLRRRELDQKQEIAVKQIDQTSRSNQSTTTNVRLAIGALCSIFALTLLYSGVTKDLASSDKILTLMSGLLGGGGAISALTKKDKPADPKP